MTYPADKPVRVNVSYEQRLLQDGQLEFGLPYVQPVYVLRTGALWSGTISEATITMTAPDGGAFVGGTSMCRPLSNETPEEARGKCGYLGPIDASEASETRLVWRLRDFKPTKDVGTVYIFASAWRELVEAKGALAAGAETGAAYLRAAQAGQRILGQWNWRLPPGILDRVAPPRVQAWAWRGTELSPESAAA